MRLWGPQLFYFVHSFRRKLIRLSAAGIDDPDVPDTECEIVVNSFLHLGPTVSPMSSTFTQRIICRGDDLQVLVVDVDALQVELRS